LFIQNTYMRLMCVFSSATSVSITSEALKKPLHRAAGRSKLLAALTDVLVTSWG
jgi:hypothetical protein